MTFLDICQTIKNALQRCGLESEPAEADAISYFLKAVENLACDDEDNLCNMASLSILLEGFYKSLSDTNLKKTLLELRIKRWENHFGTPTVPFLLTYKPQIDKTIEFFQQCTDLNEYQITPWIIDEKDNLKADTNNKVMVDCQSISQIEMPQQKETAGIFVKTHNPFGGFTTSPCDPISQQFIMHATATAKTGGKVLEIEAAFGAATLEALANGVTVFCNDIEPENLAVVRKRYLQTNDEDKESITGDSNKLVLIPGALPDELTGLPKEFFDAILICRVLHFFTGKKIEKSLTLLSTLLSPQGKIYIVCETPFLKNWQPFIPEFTKRVSDNVEWPGEITNPADFEISGRAASLPKFVHWITKEILERSLFRAQFAIEHSDYINREGQFREDLLLPKYGQESVGAIGIRRGM